MKKTYLILFFTVFCFLHSYTQCGDPYNDLAGAYVYPSVKKILVTLELFANRQYIIYQHNTNKYSNDIVELKHDRFTGYYLITDSLLMCYSDNKESIITLQLVDSLNMKVMWSKREFIKNNDFIYRVAAYFPIDNTGADPLGNGYYSKWHIYYNSPGLYECYYRSSPKNALIMFDYDDIEYFSDKIYKFKGIQYQR